MVGAVTGDAAGNVYLTGYFTGQLNLPLSCTTNAPTNTSSVFVAKLDSSGQSLWCRGFGTSGTQSGTAIAVDGSGNVIVSGIVGGTVDFGTGPLMGGGSFTDSFVATFDSSGNTVWAKAFPSANITSVAADGMGNILLAGLFQGTTTFGGPMLTGTAANNIDLAKLDSSGKHIYSKAFDPGAGANVYATTIAVDAAGNALLGGGYIGSLDFGGGPLTAMSDGAYLAKVDPQGTHLWSKNFVSQFGAYGTNLAVDATGQPILVGYFAGTVDFGGGALMSSGGQDFNGANLFIAKFDQGGHHTWSKRYGGGSGPITPSGLAVDSTGAAVVAGLFQGGLDFGNNPMMSTGGTDIFLAKLRTP